ncbi:MAG TPA: GatB/YqeY domain-containing protein [Candidatus Limnocylindria bacterium]|nr:GatB/YqeY domain-containing protein [Candidatus Limnocylindria bacterium]
MTLRERIQSDITAAMRSGEALRRDTLRMAESAIYNAEKRDRRTYTDDEIAGLIAREVKARRESVEAFTKGDRGDLAAKEAAEIEILAGYLPEQLSEAEIAALVEEAIAATGAAGPKEMGKVMGWLSPRTKGRADGRAVSQAVNASLAAAAAAGAAAGSTVGTGGPD